MPGPQGALVPDQGGPAGGRDERVRHAERARRGQPEDDPGADALRAAHGAAARLRREYLGYDGQLFGTQKVVTYEEETRSHEALADDPSGAVGRHSLRSERVKQSPGECSSASRYSLQCMAERRIRLD